MLNSYGSVMSRSRRYCFVHSTLFCLWGDSGSRWDLSRLAAHQVLPSGVNAISSLGTGNFVLGYALLAVGILSILIDFCRKGGFEEHTLPTRALHLEEDPEEGKRLAEFERVQASRISELRKKHARDEKLSQLKREVITQSAVDFKADMERRLQQHLADPLPNPQRVQEQESAEVNRLAHEWCLLKTQDRSADCSAIEEQLRSMGWPQKVIEQLPSLLE